MTDEERKRFEEMRKHAYQVDDKLDDILQLLKGDGFAHSKGLVAKVKEHEDRIKRLENFRDRTIWTIGGFSLPTAYGMWEFIKKYFIP